MSFWALVQALSIPRQKKAFHCIKRVHVFLELANGIREYLQYVFINFSCYDHFQMYSERKGEM